MKWIAKAFIWLNSLLVVATLLSYMAPYIDPESFAYLSLFGLMLPYFYLANILFVLFWLWTKAVNAIPSILCLILGLSAMNQLITFSSTHSLDQDHIIVASYNIHSAYAARSADSDINSPKAKAYKRYLHKLDSVDILSVQENCHFCDILINDALRFPFKYKAPLKGTSIYSRHPIIQSGDIDFGTRTNSCIWADIQLQDTIVRVYSVHLQSNRISDAAEDLAERGTLERAAFLDVQTMIQGYTRYVQRRSEQAKIIKRHATDCPYPVIIAGDLNDTPQSYVYRILQEDMKDAFLEAGHGMGATFAGALPGLRIDFILTDPSMEHQYYEMLPGRYSDHYPILSYIDLPDE